MTKVYWLTGLPSSGKTTLAKALVQAIDGPVKHLDGDETRKGLCADLGFTPQDRAENIRRVAWLARSFYDQGSSVVCSYVSPYEAARKMVRGLFPMGDFSEIYISTPLEVCEQRDPKGLYKQARAGKIPNFTGLDGPYERPLFCDFVFDTSKWEVQAMVDWVIGMTKPMPRTSIFIGRWQPLHEGHVKLIRTALDKGNNVVVLIRDMVVDAENPFSVKERAKMFTNAFPDEDERKRIDWFAIPEGPGGLEVCHGRKVGWSVREIHLDEQTEQISGTKIREGLE